jgi:hypothetical protein
MGAGGLPKDKKFEEEEQAAQLVRNGVDGNS